MLVNHEKKIIYIHIRKCAGNFVSAIMNLKEHATTGPHSGASSCIEECDFWDDYTKFSVVRNPWDAAVSDFFYRLHTAATLPKGHTFYPNIHLNVAAEGFKHSIKKPICDTNWLRSVTSSQKEGLPIECLKYPRSMMRHLTSNKKPNKLIINKIIRFENLGQELTDFAKSVGIVLSDCKKINETSHMHYSKYYTEQWMIDYIYDTHKDYIKHFNYEFETES